MSKASPDIWLVWVDKMKVEGAYLGEGQGVLDKANQGEDGGLILIS